MGSGRGRGAGPFGYATADVSDGDTLDFRNPERKARIIVRSQTGKQVLWTVYLKPYDPFYVGTWAVSDIKIYLDQNISGNGTGKWDTSMGGSEFGLFASPELDNIITITMNEEMVDGKFTARSSMPPEPTGYTGRSRVFIRASTPRMLRWIWTRACDI